MGRTSGTAPDRSRHLCRSDEADGRKRNDWPGELGRPFVVALKRGETDDGAPVLAQPEPKAITEKILQLGPCISQKTCARPASGFSEGFG
jgi:hypothetical protein